MSTSLSFSFILFFALFFFSLLAWFFFILIYLFFVFLGISAICRGCRVIFLEMDSQEETVSIQRFEIGIHKDLPIKKTIFIIIIIIIFFFWGGGGGELRSTFERGFFLFLFLTVFFTSDK